MHGAPPPPLFALTVPAFPFRALATLAGRLPLGGEREVALACYMGARLAASAIPPGQHSAEARATRAAGARAWFATLAIPTVMRIPCARLVEATAGGNAAAVAATLVTVVELAAPVLDQPSRLELAQLAAALQPS